MADAVTQVPPDSTGDMVDMTSLTVGLNTVHRQRIQLAGNAAADLVPADATAGLKVDLGADNDVTVTGVATAANQLADGHNVIVDNASGASAVNIQDGGNTITVDAASLPLPTGAATSANQLAADHAVDLASEHARNDAFVESIAIGGELDDTTPVAATEGNVSPARITAQRGLHTNLRDNAGTEVATASDPLRVDPTGTTTQPISASSLPLPSGAATSANQLADGHNVTVDNASGASAVNVQDGGNSLTVDNATISVVGSGTEATAQRVTIATDSTGVLSVDDNGSALSIDDGGNVISVDDAGGTLTVDNAALSTTGGGVESGALRVTLANDSTGLVSIDDNGGSLTTDTAGDVAHDAADSGNPVKQGFQAAEFDADPPMVSADSDRVNAIATPEGVQWTLGGHPNIISEEYMTTGAQTDDDMIPSVPAGSHVIITLIEALLSADTTVNVQVRIGFGTGAGVPAEPSSGSAVKEMVLSHGGMAPGDVVSKGNGCGAIAIGASSKELRITCDAPTSGKLTIMYHYWIATL